MDEPELISSAVAAGILGVTASRVRHMVRAGMLTSVAAGPRFMLLRRAEVVALSKKDRPAGWHGQGRNRPA